MVASRLDWLLLASSLLFGCAGATSGNAAESDGVPAKRAFGERCVAQPSQSGDGMLVSCDDGHFRFIVPGIDWTVEAPAAAHILVSANSGGLNLSVLLADPRDNGLEPRAHLEAIHRGAAETLSSRGFEVGAARFEAGRNGRLVLVYDVAAALEGTNVRMVNAWVGLRRADGRYVDYHVSHTAAADDPSWQDTASKAGLASRTVNLTEGFSVSD